MRVLIVVPTYNEADNIRLLLPRILAAVPRARLLVVDDNSPDGTAAVVRELQHHNCQIELRERSRKLGLGSAYAEIFLQLVRSSDVDVVCTMDADFSHDPAVLPTFLEEIHDFDVVIGSRYVAGGRVEGWSLWRRVLSRGGNLYARLVSGVPARDLTSGFTCFRRTVLDRIPLVTLHSSGYAHLMEMKGLAHHAGARIKEVPICFTERRYGSSKISWAIIREGLVAPWRIRSVVGRR
jgi:dolichol-phosphate mannosyltransferase